jgi:hypothetical protein
VKAILCHVLGCGDPASQETSNAMRIQNRDMFTPQFSCSIDLTHHPIRAQRRGADRPSIGTIEVFQILARSLLHRR